MYIIKILFYIFSFIIIWAMIGYPVSIYVLNKIYKNKQIEKNYDLLPMVTVLVVAHNEEKVILNKLENLLELDYPKSKIKFLISSDNSTDNTNIIVKEFIENNKMVDIKLYEVEERKGKTNAQNEAQKLIDTEFIVMTDSNSMFKMDAIKELMACFVSDDIAYVSGRLCIVNQKVSDTSLSESNYWDMDVFMREVEGKIQTITAGNGAIYACRNKDYYDFEPIECHDSSMPLYYSLKGKRAIANNDAIAYEKVGEVIEDEFKRKVRMNRSILSSIVPDIKIFNIFKYRWFSYFYFGHRSCRYMLWISHFLVFVLNAFLAKDSLIYMSAFILQIIFYAIAILGIKINYKNKLLNFIKYYCMTIFAQCMGVYNILTGKAKPVWEKAETTR